MELVSGAGPRCRGVRTCLDHSNIPHRMPLAPKLPPYGQKVRAQHVHGGSSICCPNHYPSACPTWVELEVASQSLGCIACVIDRYGLERYCKASAFFSTEAHMPSKLSETFAANFLNTLKSDRPLVPDFSQFLFRIWPSSCPGFLPADYPAF